MYTGVYASASCIDWTTMINIDHVGPSIPGWLCKLSEYLMAHDWHWNRKCHALEVAIHFAKVIEMITFYPFIYYKNE